MRQISFLFLFPILFSCQSKEKADLLLFNGHFISLDSTNSINEAVAVSKGKIIAIGTVSELKGSFQFEKEEDLKGQFIYPGFNDAHAHFYGLGKTLAELDLVGSKSWEEVISRTKAYAVNIPDSHNWILGRGWDQNLWDVKEFPDKALLDSLFPDQPVLLKRVDGHAAIVNQKALDLAGINTETKIAGGDIRRLKGSGKNKVRLSGILVDNAVDLVEKIIPHPSDVVIARRLLKAQEHCVKYGITSVTDPGLDKNIVLIIDSLQQAGQLKIRINAMLNPGDENMNWLIGRGLYLTERLTVVGFKFYADGAMGSRGALLLSPYSDDPDNSGLLLNSEAYFREMADKVKKAGLQMSVHCIGDSAVRLILGVYASVLEPGNDLRWRIEHSQVINPADYPLIKTYRVIPSVQPVHALSDGPWVESRLGPDRVKHAYCIKDLMRLNGWIPLGTDFPVEKVDPLLTFYASAYRKSESGWPEGGYYPEQAITPLEALKGMTIWGAMGSFEEKIKGTIEPGKYADFVVLDKDLLNTPEKAVLSTKVMSVWIAGEKVYGE